jgi:hypothetical protein
MGFLPPKPQSLDYQIVFIHGEGRIGTGEIVTIRHLHAQAVGQLQGDENGFQLVETIRAATQNLQAQIQLGGSLSLHGMHQVLKIWV